MDIRKNEKSDDCYNNTEDIKKGNEKKRIGIKHGLMMVLCCLIPIVIIGALPLIGMENISWAWMFFLLCPIMHVGMMLFMKNH